MPLASSSDLAASAAKQLEQAMKPLPLLPSLPRVDPGTAIEFLAAELTWAPDTARAAHELLERHLPPLVTVQSLAFLFGVTPAFIPHMITNKRSHYRSFEIPKKSGTRRIDAPRVALKTIQRWLHDHILVSIPLSPSATAYRKGGGIFVNAATHVGMSNLLVLDLKDFFGSVSSESIADVFTSMGYQMDVANQLAELCTYRGGLPQGAPSSPALSNAVFRDCDRILENLAESWGARYSRYADDLAFSSTAHRFSDEDVSKIQGVVSSYGFQLNPKKTRIIGSHFRHGVTGLSAGPQRVQAPRWKRRRWRAIFHQASINPLQYSARADELQGIAAFVGQYDAKLSEDYGAIASLVRNQPQPGSSAP